MEMNVEKESDENFKTTFPVKTYDRRKTTRECGMHAHTHQMLCCRITTLTFYIFNKY